MELSKGTWPTTAIDVELQQQLTVCVRLKRDIKTATEANRLAFQQVVLKYASKDYVSKRFVNSSNVAVDSNSADSNNVAKDDDDDDDDFADGPTLAERICSNPLLTWPLLQQLLILYPQDEFDWEALTCHPNIDFDTIMANQQLPWKMTNLAANPNVKASTVKAHPEVNWSLLAACKNQQLDLALIKAIREDMKRKPVPNLFTGWLINRAMDDLSANGRILPSSILANFDLFDLGNKNSLVANPNLSWSDIIKLTGITVDTETAMGINDVVLADGTVRQLGWNADDISSNPNITDDIIRAYPKFSWAWCFLVKNQQLSWSSFKDQVRTTNLIDYEMFWWDLSCHNNVTPQIVADNPDLPWDIECLMLNPNYTWAVVKSDLNYNPPTNPNVDLNPNPEPNQDLNPNPEPNQDLNPNPEPNPNVELDLNLNADPNADPMPQHNIGDNVNYKWARGYLLSNTNTTVADLADMKQSGVKYYSTIELSRIGKTATPNFSWLDVRDHDSLPWPITNMAGWALDNLELRQLKSQHQATVNKLAKLWCWKLFGKLMAPPHGLHFLLGARQCLSDDKHAEFDLALKQRDFKTLDTLLLAA